MNLVAPPNVGEIIDGKYVLDTQLGQGGMGTVFAGRNVSTGERVAIKIMLDVGEETEDVRTRFMNEAHLAGRIDSPHVARPRDSGFHQGLPYIAMELMEGEDVENTLIRRGKLPISEAIDIVVEIADALALAHQQGIIHRDIKPANVFLASTPDGHVVAKLLDFGISKAPPGMGNPSLTKTSSVMGSPMYMSPEQLKSTKGVDARTDVWSLAIVLYEAITGEAPFDGASFAALFAAILSDEIPPLRSKRPDCPPQVELAVRQALARDREQRTQTIQEFALSISAFGTPRIQNVVARLRGEAVPVAPPAPDSDRTVIAPENSQEGMMDAADPGEEGAPDSDRDRTMFAPNSPYASDPRLQAGAPVLAVAVQPTHPATTPQAPPGYASRPNMQAAQAYPPHGTQAMDAVPPSHRPPYGSHPSNPQMQAGHAAQPGTMAMPMAPPNQAHEPAPASHRMPYPSYSSNPQMPVALGAPVANAAFPVSDPRIQVARPMNPSAPTQSGPWTAPIQQTPKKQAPNVILIAIVVGVVALFLLGAGATAFVLLRGRSSR